MDDLDLHSACVDNAPYVLTVQHTFSTRRLTLIPLGIESTQKNLAS